jgi:hypothetical protein
MTKIKVYFSLPKLIIYAMGEYKYFLGAQKTTSFLKNVPILSFFTIPLNIKE